MEGWANLGSLIAARLGIEPTNAWSQVRRPNRYATESPKFSTKCSHNCWIMCTTQACIPAAIQNHLHLLHSGLSRSASCRSQNALHLKSTTKPPCLFQDNPLFWRNFKPSHGICPLPRDFFVSAEFDEWTAISARPVQSCLYSRSSMPTCFVLVYLFRTSQQWIPYVQHLSLTCKTGAALMTSSVSNSWRISHTQTCTQTPF